MRRYQYLAVSLVVLLILVLGGCVGSASGQLYQPEPVKVAWKDLNPDYVQNDYRAKLHPSYLYGDAELLLNKQGVKVMENESKVLIIQRGEAPTDGYEIKIKEITIDPQKQLLVQLEKVDPKPGQAVADALTYPMVAISLPDVEAKGIVFQPELASLAIRSLNLKKPSSYTGSLDPFAIPMTRGGFLYPLVGPDQSETLLVVREPAAWEGYQLEWIDVLIDENPRMLTARVRLVPPTEEPPQLTSMPITPLTLVGRLVGDYHAYQLKVDYMTDQNGISLDEKQGLSVGVRPHMAVPIQCYPSQELLGPVGEVCSGEPLTILSFVGQWTEIKTGTARGWIPSWYLEPHQHDQVIEKLANPTVRVLKCSSPVSLYPDGPTPDGPTGVLRGLEAGKLLTVQYRYKDWAFVKIIVYSIPDIQFGWVKDDLLVGLDQATPSEGYLKLGATVYHDLERNEFYETITFSRAVHIYERRGDMAYIQAAGGWTAWVRIDDIVYERPE